MKFTFVFLKLGKIQIFIPKSTEGGDPKSNCILYRKYMLFSSIFLQQHDFRTIKKMIGTFHYAFCTFLKTRPSCAWHVGPVHWTKMARVTTGQGYLGDEVDQSGQGDEDYQGVLGCGG